MKKAINIIIIISLIVSCSTPVTTRLPSSIDKDPSCSKSIRGFFSPAASWTSKVLNRIPFLRKKVDDISEENLEKLNLWIDNSVSDRTESEVLRNKFSTLPMSNDEFTILFKEYKKFPKSSKKRQELFYYLSWASSFHKKKRLEVLNNLGFVERQKSRESKIYRNFLKSRQKFSKIEKLEFEKASKKLKKDKSLSPDEINIQARQLAKKAKENFEQLSYSCSAKVKTDDNSLASTRFQKFAMIVTPISTASMFTYANYDELKDAITAEDKDRIYDWTKKLGYEVVLMSALNMVLAKVMSEPTGSYFSKVWKGAASDIAFIKLDSIIYGKLFSASDEQMESKFSLLKSNDDYKQMLAEMQILLDKKSVYQKFKEDLFLSVQKVAPFIGQQDNENSLVDLSQVSKEEMEKSEVKDAILKAIALQMYIEDKNENGDALSTLIHTGDKGEDRMLFFLEVAPIYHSINVGVAALIYNTICMSKNDPAAGFRKAAIIYAAWSFGYNLFEFGARQHQIGQ